MLQKLVARAAGGLAGIPPEVMAQLQPVIEVAARPAFQAALGSLWALMDQRSSWAPTAPPPLALELFRAHEPGVSSLQLAAIAAVLTRYNPVARGGILAAPGVVAPAVADAVTRDVLQMQVAHSVAELQQLGLIEYVRQGAAAGDELRVRDLVAAIAGVQLALFLDGSTALLDAMG